MKSSFNPFALVSMLLVVSLSLLGCSSHQKFQSDVGDIKVRFFSDDEVLEGETIHQEMISSFYSYTEPKVASYVNEVGHSLTGSAPKKKQDYQFFILYNDKIYAKSAPGGFVYLTTGMLNFLDNEAELAAVLATEIGSLQFQDPRTNTGKKLLEGTTQVAATIAPMFGVFGMLAMLGFVFANVAMDGSEISESQQKLAADALAMSYMVKAGYDPQGFMNVMHKFLNADVQLRPYFHDYYASNPITETRFVEMNDVFKELPLSGRSLEMNRDRFLEMTKGVREIYKTA